MSPTLCWVQKASGCGCCFVDFQGAPRHTTYILLTTHYVYPSRFFGLFGVYYSLQYLSLSDATVLTFLGPLFTGIAGAIFLKEKFTLKEGLAGCALRVNYTPC